MTVEQRLPISATIEEHPLAPGSRLRVEVRRPGRATEFPLVIFLPGASGMAAARPAFELVSTALVEHDIGAVHLDYLADDPGHPLALNDIAARAQGWRAAVSAALDFVNTHYPVSRYCPITLGYSFGGFLAVSHAAHDRRVCGSVIISGGIDPLTLSEKRPLPPMLIFHGEADQIVPPMSGGQLASYLGQQGTACDLRLLPGEGHRLSVNALHAIAAATVTFCRARFATRPDHGSCG